MSAPVPDWPSSYLMKSGGIIRVKFDVAITAVAGKTPQLKINGGAAIDCPFWIPISKTMLIRVPDASIQADATATLTLTLPAGTVTNGGTGNALVTDQSLANSTGVETLPTVPTGDTSVVPLGCNTSANRYFWSGAPYANCARQASANPGDQDGCWGVAAGTLTTDASTGLPSSIAGGTTVVSSLFIIGGATYPTGTYTLRHKGGGTTELLNRHTGAAYANASSGTSVDGYTYTTHSVPTAFDEGLSIRCTPTTPYTALELILPGYSTAGGPASQEFTSTWLTAFDPFVAMRSMDASIANESNHVNWTDRTPSGWFTDGGRVVTLTGAVGSVSAPSASTFFVNSGLTGTMRQVTHAMGDVFTTGNICTFSGLGASKFLVERVDATTINVRNFSSGVPSGNISLQVLGGVRWESIIAEANARACDLWINVPHAATDAYVSSLADLIRDNLTTGLKCYCEWSNEVWNSGFLQYNYSRGMGGLAGLSDVGTYYSVRAAQVHKLFYDSFSGTGRVGLRRVLSSQQASSAAAPVLLDEYKTYSTAQSYPFTVPDYVASAPYIGDDGVFTERARDFYLNGSATVAVMSAAQILDYLQFSIEVTTTGRISAFKGTLDTWNTTNSASVGMIGYEGGQSLFGTTTVSGASSSDAGTYTSGNQNTLDLQFRAANRHPRMANVYYQLFSTWRTNSGGLLCLYTDCQRYTISGSWGLLEYAAQVIGPGDGTGGGNDNRGDLTVTVGSEAVKINAAKQWSNATVVSDDSGTAAHILSIHTATGNLNIRVG